jgi:hypothetical protein
MAGTSCALNIAFAERDLRGESRASKRIGLIAYGIWFEHMEPCAIRYMDTPFSFVHSPFLTADVLSIIAIIINKWRTA